MEGCQTNAEILLSNYATKADESTDCVWLDTIFFHPNTIFFYTKLNIYFRSM